MAKISFTGSIRTGKIIQAAAASTLKRVTLELGGNDAAIVLDDADPAKVAPQILGHAMSNSGQVCIAVKRCYVPRAKYDEVRPQGKAGSLALQRLSSLKHSLIPCSTLRSSRRQQRSTRWATVSWKGARWVR